MRSKKYKKLADLMVRFFQTYDAAEGVPSFEKFADTVGADGGVLREYAAASPYFAAATSRCLAILRDRVTDAALLRRYDPSFCKYLLDTLNEQAACGTGEENAPFAVEIKIV